VTRSRDELIRGLAEDATPVRGLAPARSTALAWLAASALFVALATLAAGPLRPGALAQLVSEPGFALDVSLGLLAGVFAIAGLVRLRIPGRATGPGGAAPALALLGAWAGLQALELLVSPAPASTLGARTLCWLQVLAFAAPPLAAALLLARRAAPLEREWTGLLAGLAAGALPALAMQLACMDGPRHALVAHLAPVLLVAGLGGLLARLVLRRL
jgi:hypothetical protein